jgi:protease-4
MERINVLTAVLLLVGCHHPVQVKTQSHVTLTPPPFAAVGPLCEMPVAGDCQSQCKIAMLDVDGLLLNTDMVGLYSQGDNPVALFREKLEAVGADPCVRAVVLRINSHGGSVTASDIMWRDLVAFKRRRGLPVVACLMDVGTGGAYYLATGADLILAHPTTITGGMGVILNLYNLQDLMAQFNVLGVPIKAGSHVDLGSPIRPMDDEARGLLQAMANEFHARFRQVVQQGRPEHDPRRDEDFDGRVFTAQQALERRLIDRIGYVDDAVEMAGQMAGATSARVVCYRRPGDPARSVYAITPNVPIQTTLLPVSIPGIDRGKLPAFLYLWQPDPTMERLGGK